MLMAQSKDEVISELREDARKRARWGDARDFLLRKHFLSESAKDVKDEIYAIKLQTILIDHYSDYFFEENGRLRIQSSVSPDLKSTILSAFGVSENEYKEGRFPIQRIRFDFIILNALYQQDPQPIWLVLKDAIPVGAPSQSTIDKSKSTILNRMTGANKRTFTAMEKIENYIQLATAFKMGGSTLFGRRVGEAVNRIAGFFQSRPTHKEADRWIKTPGPDKAIQGVYLMGKNALAIAMAHSKSEPDCMALVQAHFYPTLQTMSAGEILAQLTQREKQDHLGNWLLLQSLFYARPEDRETYLHELQSPEASLSLDDNRSELLNSIIQKNQSDDPNSTLSQRRIVAEAMQECLAHGKTWFAICELQRQNPDWDAPDGVLSVFQGSKLARLAEEMEQNDPIARAERKLFIQLHTLMEEYPSKIDYFQSLLTELDAGSSPKQIDQEQNRIERFSGIPAEGKQAIIAFVQEALKHLESRIAEFNPGKRPGL